MSGFGIIDLQFGDADRSDLDEALLDGADPTTDPDFDWTPAEGDTETAPPPPDISLPPVPGAADAPLVAPGINLLGHSSFESESADWTAGPGWQVAVTSASFHGACSALFSSGSSSALASALVPVDPTLTHWASVWGWYSATSTGHGRAFLREYDENRAQIAETLIGEQTSQTGGFERLAREFGPRRRDASMTAWNTATRFAAMVLVGDGAPAWFVDAAQLTTGDIAGTYAPRPGEDIPGDAIVPGTLPPVAFDTTPPAVPVIASLRSTTDGAPDGTFLVAIHGALVAHPTDVDYAGCEWQATAAFTLADPLDNNSLATPDWDRPRLTFQSPDEAEAVFASVRPVTTYWVRVRSRDVQGNRSAFSDVMTIITGADASAPDVPSAPVLQPVLKGLVVSWVRNTEPDIGVYEVRFRLTGTSDPWVSLRTRGTVMLLSPLVATEDVDGVADTGYDVQVRAIDTSNQVATSIADPAPVDATAFPEAGWSDASTGYPSLTKGADIAAGSITAVHVRAGSITADRLGSGYITANTVDDPTNPDGFRVLDASDRELARWDEDGLTVWGSGVDHNSYTRLTAGGMSVVAGAAEVAAITPDGINAAALTFGAAPGGHNLVVDSGFELSSFMAPTTRVHTTAADSGSPSIGWTSARVGSLDNLSENTNDLGMTATGY